MSKPKTIREVLENIVSCPQEANNRICGACKKTVDQAHAQIKEILLGMLPKEKGERPFSNRQFKFTDGFDAYREEIKKKIEEM